MAHAFDTGLARPQRTLVRNGAVTLLSGLLRTNGGYLRAVLPWGGVIRGFTDVKGVDDLWKALLGRAPAIAIAVNDRTSEPAGIGGFNFKSELELVAYHYSNHPRSLTAGRMEIDAAGLASDTADPGLDVMLEHAEELLVGQRCGASATVKQVVPTREEELLTDEGLTLWAQRYSVTLHRQINEYRGVTALLAELRTNVRASDVAPLALAASPTGATQIGAVATFTTTVAHELGIGALVVVDGVAISGYNGMWIVTATPTITTFKATLNVSGLAPSGGGTATRAPVAATQTLIP